MKGLNDASATCVLLGHPAPRRCCALATPASKAVQPSVHVSEASRHGFPDRLYRCACGHYAAVSLPWCSCWGSALGSLPPHVRLSSRSPVPKLVESKKPTFIAGFCISAWRLRHMAGNDGKPEPFLSPTVCGRLKSRIPKYPRPQAPQGCTMWVGTVPGGPWIRAVCLARTPQAQTRASLRTFPKQTKPRKNTLKVSEKGTLFLRQRDPILWSSTMSTN